MGKRIYVSNRWLINNFMYLENYMFHEYFKKDMFENEYYTWRDEVATIYTRWNLIGEQTTTGKKVFTPADNIQSVIDRVLTSDHKKYAKAITSSASKK